MSNNTSLYSNTSSSNATVPANNNTSLYNATGVPQPVNNNLNVTGNISAGGNISAAGNVSGANLVTTGNVYAGNIIGNIVGNIVLSGGNTEVIFNNNDSACSSPAFTFNNSSNSLAVTGTVSATGNVSGNYILGNGSQLTGIAASYGNANVTTLLSAFGSNTVSTTGNITAGYFLGDGSQLTNLPIGNYSNANVAAFLPTYTGNISANAVSATGNVAGLYILGDGSQLTNLPIPGIYGNTQVASFLAAFGSNVLTTTGNVTAGYFLGDGSQLTNLPAGNYSNANVTALLANFGSNTISTTGNITGNYILGDGSQLTNLPVQPGTYSNSNVAGFLPVYTGDYAGGNLVVSGNVTAAVLKTSGATGNITGANYVSANFYLGDGGQLSNITSSYGNAQVATFLNAFGSNTISSTGNITTTANIAGNYILGNGSQLTGLPATYSNANVTTLLASFGSNAISTTGNVTAGYFVGNGSLLTNLTGANVTGTVANATFATSAGSATTATDAAQANYANIANSVSGSNVSGSVAQANVANIANSVSGSNVTGAVAQATFADTANAVAGGNVSGQVANAVVAGTVYTNAQPNITSVGTLSALSVTGNIATGGILTDNYYYANGAPFSGGGGSTYGDANVNSLLAAWGSNALSTTGNVTAGNVNTNVVSFGAGGGSLTGSTLLLGNTASAYPKQVRIVQNENVGYLQVGNVSDTGGLFRFSKFNSTNTTLGVDTTNNRVGINTGTPAETLDVAGNIAATGTLTTGTVRYSNVDGTVGQVLTTYGNGVTYFSTVSGGSGSPGGSDSQIQYNDGGAFGGNVAMTFNDTTGNVTLGNIVTNVNKIQTVATINVSAVTANGISTPYRILVGNGYVDGTVNSAYATFSPGTVATTLNSSRLLSADFVSMPNNGSRYIQNSNFTWAALTANAANANTRINSTRSELTVGGGANNFAYTATVLNGLSASTAQLTLGRGTNANLSAVGNIAATGVVGAFTGVQVQPGSSATIAVGHQATLTPTSDFGNVGTAGYGNITNMVGFYAVSGSGLANTSATPTTSYTSYYHPGTANSLGLAYAANMGNTARAATNYFSFRSDDDLAQSRLGMLSRFHELNANTATTTGTVDISKTNGQVQTIYPTGNVTIGTLSNFVTRVAAPNGTQVNTSDTVTLIIQQGATPYTVTMPTGNTQIRYASGISLVNSTANTTTMISITGVYDYTAGGNEYLITISPEFS